MRHALRSMRSTVAKLTTAPCSIPSKTGTMWRRFNNGSNPMYSARWGLANADATISYERFAKAFGTEISTSKSPLLVQLLSRVERDVESVTFSAKKFYDRPRPFQRFQMGHVCGAEKAPAPEGWISYPSGHTSFGWSTALILTDVAPDRAPQLMSRAREYGDSRIVCAVHYPSDVVGERTRRYCGPSNGLQSEPEFKKDLVCAQEEHEAAQDPHATTLSHACQLREAQIRQR